jgi:hypothetical protein
VRVNPKPVRGRRIPVVVGGKGDAALGRVAAFGDGWYGFNLTPAAAMARIGVLAGHCQHYGRSLSDLRVAVALTDGEPSMLPELARAGVTELVVVGAPPADPGEASAWITGLADRWGPGSWPLASRLTATRRPAGCEHSPHGTVRGQAGTARRCAGDGRTVRLGRRGT